MNGICPETAKGEPYRMGKRPEFCGARRKTRFCVPYTLLGTRTNNRGAPFGTPLLLVRVKGLEPSQPCGHKNLNLTRLPIPPNPHSECLNIITHPPSFVKCFFLKKRKRVRHAIAGRKRAGRNARFDRLLQRVAARESPKRTRADENGKDCYLLFDMV